LWAGGLASQVYGHNLQRMCNVANCVESLLDIEYISAVAQPIPLSVYYSQTYSLLDWIQQVRGGGGGRQAWPRVLSGLCSLLQQVNSNDDAELVRSSGYDVYFPGLLTTHSRFARSTP
jgi:hypothetical protein